METVSKKRGRPTIVDPARVRAVTFVFPGITTYRQRMAKWYEIGAVSALVVDHKAIGGIAEIFDLGRNTYRAGVLEQLGRLKFETDMDDADIRHIARLIAERFRNEPDLTTRQAVSILRQARRACREDGIAPSV